MAAVTDRLLALPWTKSCYWPGTCCRLVLLWLAPSSVAVSAAGMVESLWRGVRSVPAPVWLFRSVVWLNRCRPITTLRSRLERVGAVVSPASTDCPVALRTRCFRCALVLHACYCRRWHLLVTARDLHAVMRACAWFSAGALDLICTRLRRAREVHFNGSLVLRHSVMH